MKRQILVLAISSALFMPHAAVSRASCTRPEEDRNETAELSDIQVTARRRTERIDEVPVAVSAFSDSDLDDLQASRIDGLQGAVPNLNIVQGRGSSSNVNIFIRGIGQPDALQTFDPGVGFYVDRKS